MEAGKWTPPESEARLGLEFYATRTPGVNGQLKRDPEDFRVSEISLYPMPQPDGPFTVLRVVSRNWEQHELSDRIAQRLGLRPHSIRWAGTKDRRAVAERLASYRGLPPSRPLDLAGVDVVEAYRARDGLVLGHHFGNSFAIRVTGLAEAGDLDRLEATRTELVGQGGFPNLFGLQRFGEVRPVTHDVGRFIVRGDLPRAVDCYLTAVPPGEDGLGAEARRAYGQHRDPLRALKEFPPQFRFERQLLDHLARGHPPERALRALSRELRTLFVHAYQALLFNRYLSRRVARGMSLREPMPGDVLLRVTRDGTIPGNQPIPVGPDNLSECQDLAKRGRAMVAGPLVGFETPREPGPASDLLDEILAEEGVGRKDFESPRSADLASSGSYRPLFVPLPPIGRLTEPEVGTGTAAATLHFSLPKGSYATILVREFLKTGARPSDPVESSRVY